MVQRAPPSQQRPSHRKPSRCQSPHRRRPAAARASRAPKSSTKVLRLYPRTTSPFHHLPLVLILIIFLTEHLTHFSMVQCPVDLYLRRRTWRFLSRVVVFFPHIPGMEGGAMVGAHVFALLQYQDMFTYTQNTFITSVMQCRYIVTQLL